MHHIYHTEGIILKSKNYKEASKYYYIFTRDFGLIYAEAEGIRKLSSKLRFVLSDYSYIKLDLVKRKNIWRITNALKTNLLENSKKDFLKLKIFVNIFSLLIRLLPEQEKNENLFDDISNGLSILDKNDDIKEYQNIEIIIVLKMLYNLGYLNKDEIFGSLKSPFEEGLLYEISKNKNKILNEINKALKETHL